VPLACSLRNILQALNTKSNIHQAPAWRHALLIIGQNITTDCSSAAVPTPTIGSTDNSNSDIIPKKQGDCAEITPVRIISVKK
jgi:hypothetical protein